MVAADARREIGDVRGATRSCRRSSTELERVALAVQVRALLLESRLADDRRPTSAPGCSWTGPSGSPSPEQMRAPADARPAVAAPCRRPGPVPWSGRHRELLASLETRTVAGSGPASPAVGHPSRSARC